jgi:hypothetical protein
MGEGWTSGSTGDTWALFDELHLRLGKVQIQTLPQVDLSSQTSAKSAFFTEYLGLLYLYCHEV